MPPVPEKTFSKLDKRLINSSSSDLDEPKIFVLRDGIAFMTIAMQAISQDEFTKCFEPKSLVQLEKPSSDVSSEIMPLTCVYLLYLFGVFIRYFILFPLRYASGAYIQHHGEPPVLKEPHIFVANHTSFVDFVVTSSHKFPLAITAQSHGGIFGYVQRYLLNNVGSMTFQRNEKNERFTFTLKLRNHIRNLKSTPLLIFPEGTCVNNEYTVLFHKGAFELGCTVCPIAIKYSKALADPYWNTREQSFTQHAFYLMTRWYLLVDIWWMKPQKIHLEESAIDFANRVKAMISEQAGLQNLSWDGYMKNYMVKSTQTNLQKNSQQHYVSVLKSRIINPSTVVILNNMNLNKAKEDEFDNSKRLEPLSIDYERLKKKRSYSESNHTLSRNENSQVQLFPDWLPDNSAFKLKNEILISSFNDPSKDSGDMVKDFISHSTKPSLSDKNNLRKVMNKIDDIVHTWKMVSKMKNEPVKDEADIRRIENASWRIWYEQSKRDQNHDTIGLAKKLFSMIGEHTMLTPTQMQQVNGLKHRHFSASLPVVAENIE